MRKLCYCIADTSCGILSHVRIVGISAEQDFDWLGSVSSVVTLLPPSERG